MIVHPTRSAPQRALEIVGLGRYVRIVSSLADALQPPRPRGTGSASGGEASSNRPAEG